MGISVDVLVGCLVVFMTFKVVEDIRLACRDGDFTMVGMIPIILAQGTVITVGLTQDALGILN